MTAIQQSGKRPSFLVETATARDDDGPVSVATARLAA